MMVPQNKLFNITSECFVDSSQFVIIFLLPQISYFHILNASTLPRPSQPDLANPNGAVDNIDNDAPKESQNLEKAVVGAWRQVTCQADVVVEAPEIFHLWDEVKYKCSRL